MDYSTVIRSAIAGGASPESIAKEFTDALNEFCKINAVAEARDAALEAIEDRFLTSVDAEYLDSDNIGELAVLVYAPAHPEWDADTINRYAEAVSETARVSARIVGINNMADLLTATEEELNKVIAKATDKILNEPRVTPSKSKDDKQTIEEFLKHFN